MACKATPTTDRRSPWKEAVGAILTFKSNRLLQLSSVTWRELTAPEKEILLEAIRSTKPKDNSLKFLKRTPAYLERANSKFIDLLREARVLTGLFRLPSELRGRWCAGFLYKIWDRAVVTDNPDKVRLRNEHGQTSFVSIDEEPIRTERPFFTCLMTHKEHRGYCDENWVSMRLHQVCSLLQDIKQKGGNSRAVAVRFGSEAHKWLFGAGDPQKVYRITFKGKNSYKIEECQDDGKLISFDSVPGPRRVDLEFSRDHEFSFSSTDAGAKQDDKTEAKQDDKTEAKQDDKTEAEQGGEQPQGNDKIEAKQDGAEPPHKY